MLLPGPISVIPDMCEINYFTNSPPGPGIGMIYVNAFYFLLCYSCFLFSHPICFTIVLNMDICSRSLFEFLFSFRCMHSVISVYLLHAIMLIRPCDLDPCKPIFHIVKIGTGVTLFDIDCLIEAVLMFLSLEQN